METRIIITGGKALRGGRFDEEPVVISGGQIVGSLDGSDLHIDATGKLVLPGLVDIHGDAFERQIMPRPGVTFELGMALAETDRQLVSNGITTAFHAVTWSWEPGLRGADSTRAIVDAIKRIGPYLAADTRIHLRQETFNLDGETELLDWLATGRIDLLAFNDHMSGTITARSRPDKLAVMVQRSRMTAEQFGALVDRTYARKNEVSGSIARLAAACRQADVALLSHDDMSADQRSWYRTLGCRIAEFPINEATAASAANHGDDIVFGAPNVIRGGSHTGCPGAADMVERGMCSILASDYYYPSLLAAPFVLTREHGMPLEQAWPLVSSNAARAAGLRDRGQLAPGQRADVVIVDQARARAALTIAAGKIVYCADASLLGF
jgi:alpha-D-ribose 1-methylphosphonate 5-triphosphate diphosphatase